jgi:DNA polymerase-1
MNRDWLVLDMHNLAWRAFHTTGELHYLDQATGTIFGIIGTLIALKEQFETEDVCFAFDVGRSLRLDILPSYKEKRRKRKESEEMAAQVEELDTQIGLLRNKYLPQLGYQNVFWKKGYEADDIMAAIVQGLPDGDRAILVSGDEDLYQLLSWKAAVYHPKEKEFMTARTFREEYGIKPADWVKVKCLAGCPTDEIPGLSGVGEKTALKYIQGKLKDDTRGRNIFHTVDQFKYSAEYLRNEKLVRLPFNDLPPITPVPDPPRSEEFWQQFCEELGFKKFADVVGQRGRSYRKDMSI